MDCSEARAAMGPDLVPTPTSEEAIGAYDHYRACEACQRFYSHQIRLANRLRLLSSAKAPAGLRGRILVALDEETRRQRQTIPAPLRQRWLAGGLFAAAAAASIWFATRPDSVTNPAHRAAIMLAAIAQDSAALDATIASNQAELLRGWFGSKIGSSVDIPDIPEAQLTGGQITHLDGVATAAVHYEYHGMELLYFMIPPSTVSRRMPKDDELWSFTASGFEVVLWRDGATTRAVMAPMARPELEAIAEHCRNKTMI